MEAESSSRVNSWTLLVSLFDRPQWTFAKIAEDSKWRWLLPISIFVIFSFVASWLSLPAIIKMMKQTTALQMAQLPPESQAGVQNYVQTFSHPAVVMTMTLAGVLIMAPLGWLLKTLYFYFMAQVGGTDTTFGELWSGVLWLTVPASLHSLLGGLWIRFSGSMLRGDGLAFLFSTGNPAQDARNPLYGMAGMVNLFTLWELVLIYAMLRGIAKMGKKSAFVITVIYFLLLLGLIGGMVLLGGLGSRLS